MPAAVEDNDGGIPPRANAGQSWAQIRQRARGLLRDQCDRMQQVEAQLTEQVAVLLELVGVEHGQAEQRVAELSEQIVKLEQRPDSSGTRRETDSLLEEARIALSQALRDQQALKTQLRIQEDEVHRYRTELLENGAPNATSSSLAELQQERDSLQSRLADAEEELRTLAAAGGDSTRLNEMRERFETAVQEIRALKSENAELNAMLAGATRDLDEESNAGFDWETQKQRLLDQLEAEFDPTDPVQAKGKLTVEGAIRITDQVVARKDEEIAELKALLHDQSGRIGEIAVGATAVAAMLDDDELVQAERDRLKLMQEEWREKLRQAEVDISIERAKLARERVILDDKFGSLEAGQAKETNSKGSDEPGKKASGGNWLARLGLKDANE